MPSYRKKNLPTGLVQTQIDNLSHDGRGVARVDGKTVFLFGGLPGETVSFQYRGRQRRFDEGMVVAVLASPHPARITPRCPHFGVCGGCSLQHLTAEAQIQLKQAFLLEQFEHIGKVQPAQVMPPLRGLEYGYRRKARLGVRYVSKKGTVLVGFREHQSGWLADLTRCEVLHSSIGLRLLDLRELINQLDTREQIAQLEVAIDDSHPALIFRHLVQLTERDRQLLSDFARQHNFYVYLQPAGPSSIIPLWPVDLPVASLEYYLPTEDVSLRFAPQDFTQVNSEINQQMVPQALSWLDLQAEETVLDLFCGLGNFTLPLAKRVKQVVGIEGDASLLQRAAFNAHRQGINNINYHVANLATPNLESSWRQQSYDKVLLDPPRSGALEIIQSGLLKDIQRLLYVSCHPATLARDAGELVHQQGFRLVQAGVMDMFPQTGHVESMAMFEREA